MKFKVWVIAAVCLFGVGMGLGLALQGSTARLLAGEIASLQQLGATLAPFELSTAAFIFVKNALALLISFILSPILCLAPITVLTINGWLLSFIGLLAAQHRSVVFVLLGILPHGIFEIPALIIGEAAALSFGVAVIGAVISKEKRRLVAPNLKQNLKFLLIAAILLVPAAVIETFVTPLLLR